MNNTERPNIDFANLSPATAQLLDGGGKLPPLPPSPQSLTWQPPSQTAPSVVGTMPDRLRIYADADHRNWQEYVPDVPNAPNPIGFDQKNYPRFGGTLLNYWPNTPPQANYVLTLRSYWALVPNTYTQVHPGGGFQMKYSKTVGIPTTDVQSLCAELASRRARAERQADGRVLALGHYVFIDNGDDALHRRGTAGWFDSGLDVVAARR